jgi:threonyl-tRNA synthetase
MDAMQRIHQTATIQLDFQLPINFDLTYKSGDESNPFKRPVIIHRAVLGSVERCLAILTEHFKGKWPLWLSPRQFRVIPIHDDYSEFAEKVKQRLWDAGFDGDVELSSKTLNKKIREAQLEQYNYILVVGEKERDEGTVSIRTRNNDVLGTKPIDEAIALLKSELALYH